MLQHQHNLIVALVGDDGSDGTDLFGKEKKEKKVMSEDGADSFTESQSRAKNRFQAKFTQGKSQCWALLSLHIQVKARQRAFAPSI